MTTIKSVKIDETKDAVESSRRSLYDVRADDWEGKVC